jgi:lysyl-tRNA synthetase class 1
MSPTDPNAADLRAFAEQSGAWPFEQARAVVARLKRKPKDEVLFETGYGPSGLPHIGTFGEVARTTMVRHAFRVLTEDKIRTRLIAFSDDMDGLRKVPDNVPNKEMLEQHLGKPLTRVPDPFGTHPSFGAHNNARLRSFLDAFGFDYEFASSTDYYTSGKFDATLLKMLERIEKVMAIMLPSLREERAASYSPFLPICPRTGRVLYVPIVAHDVKSGTVSYDDPDTKERVTLPVTGGHCKLQWKPDWAMRWTALGVDYEMAGKDLIDSVKLSGKICAALDGTPPEGFNYELFLDEKGQKISKSKGNGLTIDEWLRYASPESLSLFMYREPKSAKRLYFDVIPRNVDDYQQFLEGFPRQDVKQQLGNPVWHIHSGHPPKADMPVTFQLLLTLVSSSNAENAETLWGFIGRYRPGVTPQTHPKLDAMVGYAINYYRDFVAPTKKFREPTETERAALSDLRDALSNIQAGASAEDIQNVVYEIGRREPFLDPVKKGKDGRPGVSLDWFNMLYQVLLGQEKGPRFGSFVAVYGLSNAVAMIDGALARSVSSGAKEQDELQTSAVPSASPSDVKEVDFEAPIRYLAVADYHEVARCFRSAIPIDSAGQAENSPAGRVFSMLNAITGMLFQPERASEPFGAMLILTDGRRSAVPEDFAGAPVETLALLAECSTNPLLKARLSDVCWLLDRKRGALAGSAIAAYIDIVQKVDNGELKLPFEEKGSGLDHECCDYLRRTLQIGRSIGWDKPEVIRARDMVAVLRKRSCDKRTPNAIGWFAKLDLDFRVSDAKDVADCLDSALKVLGSDLDSTTAAGLWNLAARAYRAAKRDEDAGRCQAEAAECFVRQSELDSSALIAAHHLSAAIAQLHGVTAKKARRTELRHRLIDIQSKISDEMSPFAQEMDMREIIKKVEEGVADLGLLDSLFVFADFVRSPKSEELEREAIEAIKKHPLSSLFGKAHLDFEGKTTHRTEGANFGANDNSSAVSEQIAQNESIRRNLIVSAYLDVVRRSIVEKYYLSEDVAFSLLQHSLFVPPNQRATFSRGIVSFFRGDFVSGLYILTPLLESSLRHVLKAHGHDVSIFDDATQTQKDRTLSSLFEQMRPELEQIFSQAIVADIERTFLQPPGPSIRNSLAHGLLHDGSPFGTDAIYACALIIRLCLVPLFPHRERLLDRAPERSQSGPW